MAALAALMRFIDNLNEQTGRLISWFLVAMVLIQFAVVIMRYVFGISFIWMQESIVYLHSFVFMIGAGYTLLHNGHVRVDVFYRSANFRTKAIIDIFGVVFLLLPVCIVIAQSSWKYVFQSWSIFEGSPETSGIQALFILKSVILAFCVLVALQGIGLALRSFLTLKGFIAPHEDTEVHEVP